MSAGRARTLAVSLALGAALGGCLLTQADLAQRQRYVGSLAVGPGFVCSATAGGDAACVGPESPDLGPGAFVELSAQGGFACGRTAAGRVACASGPFTHAPPVPADVAWNAMSAGWSDVCALDLDGAVSCWGSTPELVVDAPVAAFDRVWVGRWFACALDADGYPTCWGEDTVGQTSAGAGPYTTLGIGPDTACGVDADGGLECWGSEGSGWGSLDRGPWSALAMSGDGACAIGEDGDLVCVGSAAGASPVQAADVAVASGFGCAVDPSGKLACFAAAPEGAP